MSDVIEPTAVINPDGTLATGWEKPTSPLHDYAYGIDFGAYDGLYTSYRARRAPWSSVISGIV
jgi:hypothetical protein